jgi:hypothetical protein
MPRVTRRVGTALALILTASSLAHAQAPSGSRFTVEEMLKLERVSDPQLSPDGRLVAYVVTDVSLEKNSRVNHIWLVPVAGGEPVPLVRSEKSDTSPSSRRAMGARRCGWWTWGRTAR